MRTVAILLFASVGFGVVLHLYRRGWRNRQTGGRDNGAVTVAVFIVAQVLSLALSLWPEDDPDYVAKTRPYLSAVMRVSGASDSTPAFLFEIANAGKLPATNAVYAIGSPNGSTVSEVGQARGGLDLAPGESIVTATNTARPDGRPPEDGYPIDLLVTYEATVDGENRKYTDQFAFELGGPLENGEQVPERILREEGTASEQRVGEVARISEALSDDRAVISFEFEEHLQEQERVTVFLNDRMRMIGWDPRSRAIMASVGVLGPSDRGALELQVNGRASPHSPTLASVSFAGRAVLGSALAQLGAMVPPMSFAGPTGEAGDLVIVQPLAKVPGPHRVELEWRPDGGRFSVDRLNYEYAWGASCGEAAQCSDQ